MKLKPCPWRIRNGDFLPCMGTDCACFDAHKIMCMRDGAFFDMAHNEPQDACPIDKPCKQEKSSMDYEYQSVVGDLNDLAKQQYAEFQKNRNKIDAEGK